MRIVFIEESRASHPRFEPVKTALPTLLLNNRLGSSTVVGYFKPRWPPTYEFANHTLREESYAWEFVPFDGNGFRGHGDALCHD